MSAGCGHPGYLVWSHILVAGGTAGLVLDSAPMALWFDDSYRPLDLMILPGDYTYEELDAGFTVMEDSYRKLAEERPGYRVALFVDMSAMKRSEARNRRRVAATYEQMSPILASQAVGQVFVTDRAVPRGALTAVFWLKQPPWPVRVFGNHQAALDWLRSRFEAEGIHMPEPQRWWS